MLSRLAAGILGTIHEPNILRHLDYHAHLASSHRPIRRLMVFHRTARWSAMGNLRRAWTFRDCLGTSTGDHSQQRSAEVLLVRAWRGQFRFAGFCLYVTDSNSYILVGATDVDPRHRRV